MKISTQLFEKVKSLLTTETLQPCPAIGDKALYSCSYCAGNCEGGCNSTCTANCKSGNGSSGW